MVVWVYNFVRCRANSEKKGPSGVKAGAGVMGSTRVWWEPERRMICPISGSSEGNGYRPAGSDPVCLGDWYRDHIPRYCDHQTCACDGLRVPDRRVNRSLYYARPSGDAAVKGMSVAVSISACELIGSQCKPYPTASPAILKHETFAPVARSMIQ